MPLIFLSFTFLSEMSNSSVTWATSASRYIKQRFCISSSSLFLAFGSFSERFPVELIIEPFQQIAGEHITPKVVAKREKENNVPHISANILTASLSSTFWQSVSSPVGRTPYKPFLCQIIQIVSRQGASLSHCGSKDGGEFWELWSEANKLRPTESVLLDSMRNGFHCHKGSQMRMWTSQSQY